MGPKKKMNGFLLFALEKKREEEAATGKKTSLPLDQILNKFGNAWSTLPEVSKQKWKDLAKTRNNQLEMTKSRDWGDQPTSTALSPSSSKQFIEIPIPRIAPAKEMKPMKEVKLEVPKLPEIKTQDAKIILESKDENLKQIDRMLLDFLGNGQDYEEFAEQEFLLINFNNYEDCIPGELGMASFSIKNGISFDGFRIIEPKEIRSRTEEILRSMETLKLPDPIDFSKNISLKSDEISQDILKWVKTSEIDDYQRVLRTIGKALRQTNEGRDKKFINICFATSDHIKKVVGTIEWLKNASNSQDFELLVFPLEDLMIALSSKRRPGTPDPFRSKFVATYMLTHDLRFKGYTNLACSWHQKREFVDFVSVCALHKCRSQIYLVLQMLAPIFGEVFIEPTSPKIISTQDFIPKYGESKEAWEAQETKRRERIQKEIEKNRERQENMDKIKRQNAEAEQHFERLRVSLSGDRLKVAGDRGLTLALVDLDNGQGGDDDNKRRYVLAFHDKNDPSKMHAFPCEGSSSLPGLVGPHKIVDDNAKRKTADDLRKERSLRNMFPDENEENNN